MSLLRGTVAAISPLTVLSQGSTRPVPAKVASWVSYTPVVGDPIFFDVVADSNTFIVLGRQ